MVDGGEIMGGISILVSLILGLLVFITNRRSAANKEKRLTIDEQRIEDARLDNIADRRREELDRLYVRVEKLETLVNELRERDEQKQTTIEHQADELKRTNQLLADVRRLFARYTTRVEKAWKLGHTMPTLTDEEKAVLADATPR